MTDKTENRDRSIAQMEQQLAEMEKTLDQYYYEAGKSIIELAESESRKVNTLVDDIIATRQELVKLQQEIICPACRTANHQTQTTCSHCGTAL